MIRHKEMLNSINRSIRGILAGRGDRTGPLVPFTAARNRLLIRPFNEIERVQTNGKKKRTGEKGMQLLRGLDHRPLLQEPKRLQKWGIHSDRVTGT
jgi:hypothetical protein